LVFPLRLLHFPSLDYATAWRWQVETAAAVRTGASEALALLQHPPVYTFGRRARHEHLLVDPDELRRRGADVVESDRGGDVTFHGPGQLVAYPILDLRRRGLGATDYVRALEETMIGALRRFGIAGARAAGRPGVWVEGAKVGFVGVRVQSGVTTHGFALNVATDLTWFDAIVPCGLAGVRVTSIERLLDGGKRANGQTGKVDFTGIEAAVVDAFALAFDAELVEPTLTQQGYRGRSPLTGSLRGVPSEAPLFTGRSRQSTARGAGLQDAESQTRELALSGR